MKWIVSSLALLFVALPGCSLARGVSATGDAGPPVDSSFDGGTPDDVGMIDVGTDDVGPTDTGIDSPTTCTDGTTCEGADLVVCSGGAVNRTTCPLGCEANACRTLVPSNLPITVFDGGSRELNVLAGETVTFDTGSGDVTSTTPAPVSIPSTLIAQPSGPSIRVFTVGALTVASGGTIVARGPHAFAIAAAGAVQIDGTIVVRPQALGDLGTDTAGVGADGSDGSGRTDGGAAGGAFAGAGGAGGTGGGRTGATASVPHGSDALTPLVGGAHGGIGGDDDGGDGGFGGGAIQIVSRTSIRIGASGVIDASGGGGLGGDGAGSDSGGGGGGGSGGGILLEAITVTIDGVVSAMGGAGGAGSPCANGCAGTPGVDGASAAPRAPAPRTASTASGGYGGAGGTTTDGEPGGSGTDDGGGGGGGAGRIRINTAAGTETYDGSRAEGALRVGMVMSLGTP